MLWQKKSIVNVVFEYFTLLKNFRLFSPSNWRINTMSNTARIKI